MPKLKDDFDMVIDSRGKCFKAKPGKNGTLYRYATKYTDAQPNSGCPIFITGCWAYDQTHADMKFADQFNDETGWKAVGESWRVEI